MLVARGLAVSLPLVSLPLLLSAGLPPVSPCRRQARVRCRSCRFNRLQRHERLEPSNSATASSLVHCWQKRSRPPRPSGMASALAWASAAWVSTGTEV